jgi:hypothetical protein
MADKKGDINLPKNKCGIVYGAKLDSNWSISMLTPDIVGGPYKKAKKMGPAGFKNACAVNNMATMTAWPQIRTATCGSARTPATT